jgi:hypothetical protein
LNACATGKSAGPLEDAASVGADLTMRIRKPADFGKVT